jgi:hypothetical protein
MKGVSGYDQEREIEAVQAVVWAVGVVIFAPSSPGLCSS